MGKTVLLVEDEPHIIEALSFLLEQDGWAVMAHSDGASATERAVQDRPDVVVLDAMLPGKSGFEILREIRARPDLTALPVLMLTAKGQNKDRAAALEAGANDFMTKPFSNLEIVEAVRALFPDATD